jgi:Protein of unknown function (DUF1257)
MSAYTEQVTQITDGALLTECLKEKGIKEVENHDTPQNLVGYQNDTREQKAEIIIRRKHVGAASNDIGFQKQSDGTYRAIISQFDKGRYNDAWMSDLKKKYAEKKIHQVAKKNGLTFVGKVISKTDGSFKLNFVKA